MFQALEITAPAKLNLTLRVVGRRADGFHLLDSVVGFSSFGDRLRIQSVETEDTVSLSGPFANCVDGENIVTRALKAYRAVNTLPSALAIDIEKNIPVSAGLGGGSCDAGALLRALQTLAFKPLPPAELAAIAKSLGADVTVCLGSKSTQMRGIGEILRTIGPLPLIPLVLINPGTGVSAGDVFRHFKGPYTPKGSSMAKSANEDLFFHYIGRHCHNDLLVSALSVAPQIPSILKTLDELSCVRAFGMSGSGATCFALFNSHAQEAARKTANIAAAKGWWAVISTLLP